MMERLLFVLAGAAAGFLLAHPFEHQKSVRGASEEIPVESFPIASRSTSATTSSAVAQTYAVVSVTDGDTITVLKDGAYTKVRLIGIDTPETYGGKKAARCFGMEATQRAHELLDSTQVTLEMDPSQGTTDRYGRMLAYVFLSDGTSYEQRMIAEGYGREYTFRTAYRYQKEFRAAQAEARAAQNGLWSACTR